jgi:drug/metabolite transporter (DMT)-like permease
MAPVAIAFGVLLGLLGPILFFLSDPEKQSPTAFIPSGFGIALIVLGVIARNEKIRMHAMHGAALVGLLGFVLPLGRVIYASTKPEFQFGLAAGGSIGMSVLCLIFLGLCVKSFIDARIARKQKEAQIPPPAQ